MTGRHILQIIRRPQPIDVAERAEPALGGDTRSGQNHDLFHHAPLRHNSGPRRTA